MKYSGAEFEAVDPHGTVVMKAEHCGFKKGWVVACGSCDFVGEVLKTRTEALAAAKAHSKENR